MDIEVCKLCLKEKPLQKSHLIPAAAYKGLADYPNTNPVLSSFDSNTQELRMVETSRQIQEYLMCWDCEQLLRQNGEDWILARVSRDGLVSPLFEVLSQRKPIVEGGPGNEITIYATSGIPEFEKDKIIHFALGVFFKAAAYKWRMGKYRKGISLGVYLDGVRRYLLGESEFPNRCALWFSIIPPNHNTRTLCAPYQWAVRECHTFGFIMLGLEFVLSVGKQIPAYLRNHCFVRSPGQPVFVTGITARLVAKKSAEIIDAGRVFGKLRTRWGLPRK
jgi:hypothetical protein